MRLTASGATKLAENDAVKYFKIFIAFLC